MTNIFALYLPFVLERIRSHIQFCVYMNFIYTNNYMKVIFKALFLCFFQLNLKGREHFQPLFTDIKRTSII